MIFWENFSPLWRRSSRPKEHQSDPQFSIIKEKTFSFSTFSFSPPQPLFSSHPNPSSRPLLLLFSSIDDGKNTCMTFRNFCHPSMTNDTFSDTFFHSHFFHDEWREAIKCNATPRRSEARLGFLCNQQKIYIFFLSFLYNAKPWNYYYIWPII